MSRDDVVLQRPEDIRFVLPVFHTAGACPGAVTAYLLRRIAYRAGACAPGIQELIFHGLNTSGRGGTDTQVLIAGVKPGRGYRGVMLLTDDALLHPEPDAADDVRPEQVQHA